MGTKSHMATGRDVVNDLKGQHAQTLSARAPTRRRPLEDGARAGRVGYYARLPQ